MSVFADYSRYYDLLYGDKDYRSETEYVTGVLGRYAPHARSVLELGSGTGRHAEHLVETYAVAGIERSEQMLGIARSRCPAASFTEGDIRHFELGQTFDAVLALFHVVSYQTGNEDLLATFRAARRHLIPGGVFLFDFWYGPAVLTLRPSVRVKRFADERLRVTRVAEPELHHDRNLVNVDFEILVEDLESGAMTRLHERHPMRYLFLPEIDLLAMQTGFRIGRFEEWMTASEPAIDAWSVTAVLLADD